MTDHSIAFELLQRLRNRGAQLWEEQGKLNYRAPQGVISADDLHTLRAHKANVLAILAGEQQQTTLIADETARFAPFPLSQVQAAYLVGRNDAFGYGGVACHVYLEVNYPLLQHARVSAIWNELVARHDMLRAVFDRSGSQRVLPDVPELIIDCASSGAEQGEALLDSVKQQMGHRLYQPEQWPLFSLSLSQLPARSVLHLSMDFLIADWASIWLLLGEFEARYQHPDQPLPPLKIQFRDYLLAERGMDESPAAQRDRAWWQQRIPQLPASPQLPLLDTQERQPARFTRRFLQLPEERWAALKQQAAQCGITPTAAVLTAYASVLQRWSASEHFCLNLTVLNRQPLHEQVDRLVGDFTSVSLLEVDQRRPMSWAERASAISQQLYDDLDHRLCSGVEVIRELARAKGRDYALMPYVFTSAIGLVPADAENALQGKLDGRGITQTPQVFIDCQAMDSAAGLQVNWDVRDGVFPSGMIDDLFASFESLLNAMAQEDAIWQQTAQVALPEWQREQRLQVNDTHAPLPEGGLHQPFFAQAHLTPDALAVIDPQQQMTYRQLADAALRIAGHLQRHGVAIGEPVAITLEKGVMQAAAVLGAMAVGAVWVPVDVSQPAERRRQILANAGIQRVLTQQQVVECGVSGEWRIDVDALNGSEPLLDPHASRSSDAAYIIYTSGSTGQPKGVVMGHQAARNTVEDINRRFAVRATDRVLALAQLGFDLAIYDLFGPLSVGGAVIYPEPARATNPSHWIECIESQQVTLWNSVPALMQMLESALQHQQLASLRLALLSGDWIPLTLPESLATRLPQLQLVALGGATEAAIWSNYHCWQGRDATWRSIPYGLPLSNQGFRVLDDNMADCPVWLPGNLYISGAGLAQGYLKDAEKTARHFIHHPHDQQRLYWTGDRARYLPNGELEFLGRADNQLKIKGHRIEPGEIEAALSALPGVESACVVPHGEGSQRQLLALVSAQRQPANPVDYDRLTDSIDTATAGLVQNITATQLQQAMTALDAVVLQQMRDTLQAYGLNDEFSEAQLRETPVNARFFWLVRRWQAMLAQAGALPDYSWQQVDALWQPLLDGPAFLAYIRSNLENLAGLLEGRVDAQKLLFPQGQLTNVQALYRENLMAKYLNQAVSALTSLIAQQRVQRPLRILEVGAGTGGTTADVLAALSEQTIEYHFTDVAAFFLPEARARYGQRAGMHFGLLNIDDDIRSQGYCPESFDIVLAAGVLENARDQRRALENIQLLTAPQGWVILTEPTRECPWIMASQAFMMTPPEDSERQQESYLDQHGWQALMQSVSGDPVLCLPRPGHVLHYQGFHLLAQQIKRDRLPLYPQVLLDALQQKLPRYMIPAQIQSVAALPLTANGKVDRNTVVNWWVEEAAEHDTPPGLQPQGDALEQLLCQHWAETLGIKQIALDQDVYNLGADSLIMARMAGKLRQVLAADPWQMGDIPFDTLLRHMLNGPTVRALAQAIRSQHAPDAAAAAPQAGEKLQPEIEGRAEGSNGILLPMGGGSEGPLRVVFHAGLGTMDCFRPMLAELEKDPRGPVIGIVIADTAQYCALSPQQAVERMADDYAQRLLATGHSRFQLIGYCLGGLFAVEVARRLSEQGAEIADLVLISSHPVLFEVQDDLMIESLFIPNLHITLAQAGFGEVDGDALVKGFMQVIEQHHGRIPQGALAQLPGAAGLFFQQMQSLPIEERFARYVAGVEQFTGQQMPAEMALGLFRVFRQSFHAAHFTPSTYVGDIRFLLPNQGSGFAPGMDDNTLNFWRNVCLGDLQVTSIAGNHFSCIDTPNAQAVAQRVNEGLK
ncbi:non-ribosomal peptide synthetase [Serratia marcescens]|uniref:non-ribosomal peptide synthetase n=1 Tax=Serratia marcescens TaxID=615 RepID=UPI0007452EE9|nr:non-ribosomal peptide synthetase [Serratia marcescens]CUY79188.1 Phenyloxazoline synthase MbtB [Serratia marcescens]HAT3745510.1 non-ribosomal peptide synthetase [Serratia marcescens]HAT3783696.1 non-ribosomal peptide synthetase [Serratia marcescens]HAT3789235.1 non-ribosomal peptide synthetase [Serratia marcescens]HAT3798564.1 non-ribosomal peptide synthetase [Serratia marcescens]